MKLNKTKYSLRKIISWLWSHHKGCRMQAVVNAVTGLLQVILGLIGVDLLRSLTDIATGAKEGEIGITAMMLAGVFVLELMLHILTAWVSSVLAVRAQNELQRFFFLRLLKGQWQGIEKYHSGDVLNRLFSDVNDIVRLMTEVIPSTVIIVFQFAASFIYLYMMDSMLAIILVVLSPIFLILSRFYFHKMRKIVRHVKDSNSAIQAIIQESVQHKMVIKTLERTSTMLMRLEQRQGLLYTQIKARARFSIFSRAIINIGFTGAYLASLVWGLYQLQEHIITVGVLIAFTQLINRIQRPMLDMAHLLPTFVNSMTSSERLMELEEMPLEDITSPHKLQGGSGLRFENVNYQYPASNTHKPRQVLRDFSFDFRPGSFTAILGETGAGKTTLIRLMLSLISQNSGKIVAYDDNGEYPVTTSLRCNFSYIPQGNTLFSGTIRENLLLGNPDATEQQLKEALHLALADFVLQLPRGLDTGISEHGGGLSEGQAQRISIARALLRPCKILLLDEATSALDMETEKQLLENIKKHYTDGTIIFVTHRLAVTDYSTDILRISRQK